MIKRSLSFVLATAVAAALSSPASAQTLDGKTAFEKLKTLTGTWSGPIGSATGVTRAVRVSITLSVPCRVLTHNWPCPSIAASHGFPPGTAMFSGVRAPLGKRYTPRVEITQRVLDASR